MRTFLRSMVILLLAATARHAAAQSSSSNEMLLERAVMAHGTLMGLAFAVFFPIGATIMHGFKFKGFVWFHGGWQIFAYIVALAGFGLGVWIAVKEQQLIAPNGHPIIGIIVMGILFFQPIGGWLAHRLSKQKQRKTITHSVHRWAGRVFLIIGAINGGLGLQLSGSSASGEIAYGVIAGFFFLLWFAAWLFDWFRTQQKQPAKTSPGSPM